MKNFDSAVIYANKLIAEARQKNDKLQEARVRFRQSKQAYKTGNQVKALDYARQSLSLTNPSDACTYTDASTMIAYILSNMGKDVEALNTAFKILRETDARGWKSQNVSCLACIADLYRAIGKIPQALIYALQASAGAKANRDSGMYLYTLSTLSNLYSDRSIRSRANLEKATAYMEIVLTPQYVHLYSNYDYARYLGNLGRLYNTQNNPKAEAVLKQTIAITQQGHFTLLEKHALNELMSLYIDKSHFAEAIKYGEQAIAVEPESQSDKVLQRNIFSHLSNAYVALHKYEQAFKYFQKETALTDSIQAADKAKDALELDKKYSADKRLLIADGKTKLLQQQRNFIIVLALIIAAAATAVYRWLVYKRNREAALLAREHQQLEKLDALKTRFFANISHELRTPLTLIIGPADQLLNKQVNDEAQQQSYLLNIIRNGERLLNIVNELLDLGKLEAGKLSLKLKPVALAPFIKVLYHSFLSAAENKKIDSNLICDINENLFAEVDRERFEKIGYNLIGNAIKFTPQGGSITVEAAIVSKCIEFSVANTGSGIHPDDLPHVFDRYYQGNSEEQRLEGGTGIGLAIVREFVVLMGGEINIDNKWGESVTFKITVPLINAEQRTIEMPEVADQVYNVDPVKRTAVNDNQLVLVVEDNPEMANYITTILQPTHTTVTTYNGAEALSTLQAMPNLPSLIISDVMMPGMDGFTLLEKLKQDAVYCTIPIIMLTALTDTRHKLKALNIGVDDYITKPFLNSELIARVTNLINNAAARKASNHNTHELKAGDYEEIIEVVAETEEDELLSASPANLAWLSELEDLVRKYIGKTDLNLAMLSNEMAISERQLFRRIKTITGLTPNKYIRAIRLQIAREAIETGKYRTIAEVSYAAGFDTPTYFSKLFKEHYGKDVGQLL